MSGAAAAALVLSLIFLGLTMKFARTRAVPDARALITVEADAEAASALSAGEFSWERAPDGWRRSLSELATVMVADWPELGLAT